MSSLLEAVTLVFRWLRPGPPGQNRSAAQDRRCRVAGCGGWAVAGAVLVPVSLGMERSAARVENGAVATGARDDRR